MSFCVWTDWFRKDLYYTGYELMSRYCSKCILRAVHIALEIVEEFENNIRMLYGRIISRPTAWSIEWTRDKTKEIRTKRRPSNRHDLNIEHNNTRSQYHPRCIQNIQTWYQSKENKLNWNEWFIVKISLCFRLDH